MKLLAFLPILLFPSAVGAKQNDRLYNYIERYSCWNLQKERTIPKKSNITVALVQEVLESWRQGSVKLDHNLVV